MNPKNDKLALGESQINYFQESLCPLADKVYRLLAGVCMDKEIAHKHVLKVYEKIAAHLVEYSLDEAPIHHVIREAWSVCESVDPPPEDWSELAFASKLSKQEKFVFFAVDALGVRAESVADALGWEELGLRKQLSNSRQSFLG